MSDEDKEASAMMASAMAELGGTPIVFADPDGVGVLGTAVDPGEHTIEAELDPISLDDILSQSAEAELEVGEGVVSGEKAIEVSPTALKLDDWSIRRGREVLEECDAVKELFDGLLEHVDPESEFDEKQEREFEEQTELATADFHAAAFEPDPELAPKCKNERLRGYMEQLFQTPEFQALHNETQLDPMASEIATVEFAKQWVEIAKTEVPDSEFGQQMQAVGGVAKALSAAKSEVDEMRDCQHALGMGGDGATGGKINRKQLSDMFKRVRGSKSLKKICEYAGRYRRFAQAQQRKKVLHGQDDMVGVVQDGDIGRLLPSELGMLSDEVLGYDVMRRIVERQAMCRDFRGIEKQAKGPIVVVVDESGSMSGDPVYTAKAMALALSWVAKSQNRFYCLVGFSGGTSGVYCVAPPNKPPRYKDFQDDDEWTSGEDSLMRWLEHFYSGGTDLDCPLQELPLFWKDLGCPPGKTDIVCITDASLHIPDEIHKSFLEFKAREKVKMTSLILGRDPGEMSKVSDRTHCVKTLSLSEDAVAEALSV
jgi:uncharacterized protein with von Willebrand factor type A (vWA) domain